MRQTSASRFSRAVKKIAEWCRRNRHQPVPEQHATLSQKLRGHDGYYGIIGNSRALSNLRYVVAGIWRKWLSRRSWAGSLSWERFKRLGGVSHCRRREWSTRCTVRQRSCDRRSRMR